MDMNVVVQAIGTLGFPIVCCAALFWRSIKADDQHKAEMDKLSEALNNNTIVMNKIYERLSEDAVIRAN